MVKNNPELEISPTTTLFLTLSNSAKGAELGGPNYTEEIPHWGWAFENSSGTLILFHNSYYNKIKLIYTNILQIAIYLNRNVILQSVQSLIYI